MRPNEDTQKQADSAPPDLNEHALSPSELRQDKQSLDSLASSELPGGNGAAASNEQPESTAQNAQCHENSNASDPASPSAGRLEGFVALFGADRARRQFRVQEHSAQSGDWAGGTHASLPAGFSRIWIS